MRAMRLTRPDSIERHPLALADLPRPDPRGDELLLEVSACAVCRTDLQICEGDLEAHQLPITPGHQVVGRVVEAGPDARNHQLGDRVGIAWLGGSCGACARCDEGRENLCEHAVFTGWDRDGGYAEYVTVRSDFAIRIPDAFDDLDAAPLLCGGIIGYRSLKISTVQPGQRLGLFGFGASALLALQVARHWGCRVFVRTRSKAEQERALRLGAEWAGSYDEPCPEALDAAITFAPVGSVVVAALQSLDRGGTVAINAIHLDRIPEFSYDRLWLERSLRSVANFTREDAREFLDVAAQIPIQPSREVFTLEEANVALERLKQGRIGGAAVLRVGAETS